MKQPFVSTDERLMTKRPFSSTSISFAGGIRTYKTICPPDVVAIDEEDLLFFLLVMLHFFPNWDQYKCYTSVSKHDWHNILARWAFLSGIDDFDTFIEAACDLDYAHNTVEDKKALYLINNNAERIWEIRCKERILYENFSRWCETQFKRRYTYITIFGF
jgi:hypothetical protein